MASYTFDTLSPIDFENLVRDLLQEEFSITFETFKQGKDNGIDLRYSSDSDNTTIVQAKHYRKTGLTGLLGHLRKEKAKVDKIQPAKYIIATSVPLSPANKDEMIKIFNPYIKSNSDIYGLDDINNLLGKFHHIEKKNFKLWMTSVSILEEIFHGRILNKTRFSLHEIEEKAKLYVMNDSYNKAICVLKEYNIVIIAGIPGIGKTTLAQMLILHFLKEGYQFIEISNDIEDAYTLHKERSKQIYLYDDFLGKTSLSEKLKKNEDQRLLSFVSHVKRSKSEKIILTTREYLLNQARTVYENLNNPLFENPKLIIDLSYYTKPIKAEILYNHLYFSSLSEEYVETFVDQKAFLKVIDHKNYSPRIIKSMTNTLLLDGIPSSDYPAHFIQNLDNPQKIWEHAFCNQIIDESRDLLIVMCSLPSRIRIEDLQSAVQSYWETKEKRINFTVYEHSLSELQGNFISINRIGKVEVITFHNPSIKDFLINYIRENQHLYYDLVRSMCFFEQIMWVCEQDSFMESNLQMPIVLKNAIIRTLKRSPCVFDICTKVDQSVYIHMDRLNIVNRVVYITVKIKEKNMIFLLEFYDTFLKELQGKIKDAYNDSILSLMKLISQIDMIEKGLKDVIIEEAKNCLLENTDTFYALETMLDFYSIFPALERQAEKEQINNYITELSKNLRYESDVEIIEEELQSMHKIQKKYNIDLKKHIDYCTDRLNSYKENSTEREEEEINYVLKSNEAYQTDDKIIGMFNTLITK